MNSRLGLMLCAVIGMITLWLPGAEPPAPAAPDVTLIALANDGKLSQLLPEYLKLQWLRLKGAAPSPAVEKITANDVNEKFVEYYHEKGRESLGRTEPLSSAELEQLDAWFKKKPHFRERFLLALDGAVDNLPAAARVALKLHEKFPRESETYEDLVIAFATVWDDPALIDIENKFCVPELQPEDKTFKLKLCSYEDSFGWFAKNANRMCPWFKIQTWRLMVYTVDEYLEPTDRDWIAAKYPFKIDLGSIYGTIVYDYVKMNDNKGKLGNSGDPYTLPNLLKYGGVCRDQAFYARAACRAYGMPSYMATGQGARGGHAWVGWIVNDGRTYKLTSFGRYKTDNYYTAGIIDPKSGRFILDYLVGLEALGMNNEAGYDQAEVYYRVWREFGDKLNVKAKTNLVVNAVQKNAYHRLSWLAVNEALANGDLPASMASAQWNYLIANFSDFPDFTYFMLRPFSKMFKTPAEKHVFYDATTKVFEKLKRADLVAKVQEDEKNEVK